MANFTQYFENEDSQTSLEALFASLGAPLDKKPLDLVRLISNVAGALSPRFLDSDIELYFISDEDFMACYGDVERLEEILRELINHAFHHTNAGGSIHVSLSSFKNQGHPFAHILIQDDGRGIPEDQLDYLFCDETEFPESIHVRHLIESGLSLASVEKLVILHEGGICVRSELESGSVYRVGLPLMKMKAGKYD